MLNDHRFSILLLEFFDEQVHSAFMDYFNVLFQADNALIE